jgi:hypothetical protein
MAKGESDSMAASSPLREAELSADEDSAAVEETIDEAEPAEPSPPAEEPEVESPSRTAAAAADGHAAAPAPGPADSARSEDAAKRPAEGGGGSLSPTLPPPPLPERSLADLRAQYQERGTKAQQSTKGEAELKSMIPGRSGPRAAVRRRPENEALTQALAQEMFVFALEWRKEGNIEAARAAFLLLTSDSNSRTLRKQAWKELIELEAELALGSHSEEDLLRAAQTAGAFLREFPGSLYRPDILKVSARLWAELVDLDPERYCEPAMKAVADLQTSPEAREDPAARDAAEEIRVHCLR